MKNLFKRPKHKPILDLTEHKKNAQHEQIFQLDIRKLKTSDAPSSAKTKDATNEIKNLLLLNFEPSTHLNLAKSFDQQVNLTDKQLDYICLSSSLRFLELTAAITDLLCELERVRGSFVTERPIHECDSGHFTSFHKGDSKSSHSKGKK